MARFYTSGDFDLDVEEIYDELSSYEINELIDILVEEGYVIKTKSNSKSPDSQNTSEWLFTNMIGKIINNRLRLNQEEEELLQKISDRF
jgi:hypothetical protein